MSVVHLWLSAAFLLATVIAVNGGRRCSIDVIAVVDGSDSLTSSDFSKLKSAVTALAEWGLNQGEGTQRLGVVVYSSKVSDTAPLSSNLATLKSEIAAFDHPMEGTATHLGILGMKKMFEDDKKAGVPQVGIVITDGRSKDPVATQNAASAAKNEGIRMIAVGIGHKVNSTELAGIASSQKDVKTISDFDQLRSVLSQLVKEFCIVDGNWTEWSETISSCSQTCDKGLKTYSYSRTCTNPAPENGGAPCTGAATKFHTETCMEKHCPVPGGWTEWTVITGQCSVTCGGGVKTITETRSCTNPKPRYGGTSCAGVPKKERIMSCNAQECLPDPCAGCRYENGVGYMPHPHDCRRFLQCVNYGKSYIIMPCPAGLYWNQAHLNCLRSRDKCSPDTPVEVYDESTGTTSGCDGTKHAVAGNVNVYVEVVPQGLRLTRPCAPGTVYDPKTCNCVHGGTVTKTGCTPELYIPFNGDASDKSGKNNKVDNLGVTFSPANQGVFVANTGLRVNRFSNMDFGDTLTIKFIIMNTKPSSRFSKGQAVVTNAHCKEDGTIYITTTFGNMKFTVYNKAMKPHTLNIPYPDPTDELTRVTLSIGDGKMKASVNDIKKTLKFEGKIAKTHCALHVGQGTGYANFLGIVDEFKLYLCKP